MTTGRGQVEKMVTSRFSRLQRAVGAGFVFGVLALAAGPHEAAAQGLTYTSGQSLSPAFEGWEANPDGSFNLLFGYMNRNWEEEPNVQIGDDNHFSPGPADRGQPTHFLPRRNRFVFKVQVPADFGEQELAWTVRVNGVEKAAYGSLKPDYFVDNMVIMSETGTLGPGSSNPELRAHTPPVVELEQWIGRLRRIPGERLRHRLTRSEDDQRQHGDRRRAAKAAVTGHRSPVPPRPTSA